MRITTAALATALIAGLAATATAFAPSPKAEQPLETDDAVQPPRSHRDIVRAAPAAARAAIDRARAAGLGQVLWDADTDVASQLWGAGIGAPGANAIAANAEAAARAFLVEHLALVAPGSSAADFEVVANVVAGDLRAVGFAQHSAGARVLGGQLGFLFKNDRLIVVTSSALPHVAAPTTNRTWKPDALRSSAQAWVAGATGRSAIASAPTAAATVLPIVRRRTAAGPDIEYRTVHTVRVDLVGDIGSWDVYVDAATGAALARRSQLKFAQGTIVYNVPERWPGATRLPYPAPNTTHQINGGPITSSATGVVTWAGATAATVNPGLRGTVVRIINELGALASTTFTLDVDQQATWDESASGTRDAQLTAFIHANQVKAYVKQNIAPNQSFLDQLLDVHVNESGNCNAYSTGDDIHFFGASGQCENTGRLADVVYHEFGHSLHAHAIIPGVGDFDGALSEGISDFLAATITGDPGMGRGFFFTNAPLRHIDPTGSELRWPENVTGEVHADGEIIAGTLWDLRKALVARMGDPAGVRHAERLFYAILQTASDIPSTYASALAADDDDGNLANGTPNQCAIREAFAAHGLADLGATSGGIGLPTTTGLAVAVQVTGPTMPSECPPPTVVSGDLLWSVRGVAGTGGRIDLVQTDLGSGNSSWSASLPPQGDAVVIKYRVELNLTDASLRSFPDNPADKDYELYTGQIETIWCDDFETGAVDWTHGADVGTDEWEVAVPTGLGGDPTTAISGTQVVGTDLTGNGEYRRSTSQWMRTPAIDVTGRDGVRLQYKRWLNVEDAYYDTASISIDGAPRWSNLNSMQGDASTVAHRDREWRFHDVDLAAEAADGSVQVEFRLDSDAGLQFGGWTMDDVCIVARLPGGVCGDSIAAGVEECDDGNLDDGDGCSALCLDEEPVPGGGCCSTGTGPGGPMVLGLFTLGLVMRRRRRA